MNVVADLIESESNPTPSTLQVLAMEYCPGIKVSDIKKIEAAGIDRKLLAKRSAESYLYQLCRYVLLLVFRWRGWWFGDDGLTDL